MATFNKFNDFILQLGLAVHNLNTHTLKAYLSNAAPSATHTAKAQIADITAQNGYPAGGSDILNAYTQTGGTGFLTATDVVFTASGGSFGPFRYVPIYNDDATSPLDALVAWWDYGSSIACNDGETFTVDFGANVFTLV